MTLDVTQTLLSQQVFGGMPVRTRSRPKPPKGEALPEYDDQLLVLMSQNEQQLSVIKDLQTRNGILSERVSELESYLADSDRREVLCQSEQHSEPSSRIQELEDMVRQLKQENENLEHQNDVNLFMISEAEQDGWRVPPAVEEMNAQIEHMKHEFSEAINEQKSQSSLIEAESAKRIFDLLEVIKAKDSFIEEMRKDLSNSTESFKELESKLAACTKKLQSAEYSLLRADELARNSISELNSEISKIKTEFDAYRRSTDGELLRHSERDEISTSIVSSLEAEISRYKRDATISGGFSAISIASMYQIPDVLCMIDAMNHAIQAVMAKIRRVYTSGISDRVVVAALETLDRVNCVIAVYNSFPDIRPSIAMEIFERILLDPTPLVTGRSTVDLIPKDVIDLAFKQVPSVLTSEPTPVEVVKVKDVFVKCFEFYVSGLSCVTIK